MCCPSLGCCHQVAPAVRHVAQHHLRLPGLHAASGYPTQCYCFLIREPQSHRHGKASELLLWIYNSIRRAPTCFAFCNLWLYVVLFFTYLQAKAGIVLNLLGVLCVQFALNTWGVAMFQLKEFPTWANTNSTTSQPWSRCALLPLVEKRGRTAWEMRSYTLNVQWDLWTVGFG